MKQKAMSMGAVTKDAHCLLYKRLHRYRCWLMLVALLFTIVLIFTSHPVQPLGCTFLGNFRLTP